MQDDSDGLSKRKRGHDTVPALQTNQMTACQTLHSDIQNRDEGSPRTVVAKRLQILDLESESSSGGEATNGREREQKRARAGNFADECPESSPCPPPHGAELSTPRKSDLKGAPFTSKHVDGMLEADLEVSTGGSRPKSPSLSREVNDLYWTDAEITGHDPDDPTDDGYGINGIGFRPTAGQAYQRSQRRKQQLSEYRSRETKDARQRRSERRRTAPADGAATTTGKEQRAIVHFEDG